MLTPSIVTWVSRASLWQSASNVSATVTGARTVPCITAWTGPSRTRTDTGSCQTMAFEHQVDTHAVSAAQHTIVVIHTAARVGRQHPRTTAIPAHTPAAAPNAPAANTQPIPTSVHQPSAAGSITAANSHRVPRAAAQTVNATGSIRQSRLPCSLRPHPSAVGRRC